MKRYLNLHILTSRQLIWIGLVTLLFSCSASPEEYGRRMAEHKCKCGLIRIEMNGKKHQQLAEDLKAGKFQKRQEAQSMLYSDTYNGKFKADSADYAQCMEELEKMGEEGLLKFARDDDRSTLSNAFDAHMDAGQKKLREKEEMYNSAEEEAEKLMNALPWQ